jgi:hypothetical protein
LASLERTAIGPYLVKDAYSIEKFENNIKELKQN